MADAALDPPLLVAASWRHRARLVAVMPGQGQKRGVQADGIPAALEHGRLQVVVQGDPGGAAPGFEGGDVAAQEALHARVKEETQEDLARPRQHHDEAHEGAARAADLQMPEVRPVDLGLLPRQRAQAQIGLGSPARAVARDEVAEVVRAPAIAALTHHGVQPRGRERGELLERLADEGQIGLDGRGAVQDARHGRQAGLGQHPGDGVAVHMQLRGNGADAPALGVVVAQDLRLDLRGRGHVADSSSGDDGCGGAGSPVARTPRPGPAGKTGSATGAPNIVSSPPTPPVEQAPAWVGNPDASLCVDAPSRAAAAARARAAPAATPGNAAQPHAKTGGAPVARSHRRNTGCRGRSGCRSARRSGSAHRDSGGLERPSAAGPMTENLISTGVTASCHTPRATSPHRHGARHRVKLPGLYGAAPASPAGQRRFYSKATARASPRTVTDPTPLEHIPPQSRAPGASSVALRAPCDAPGGPSTNDGPDHLRPRGDHAALTLAARFLRNPTAIHNWIAESAHAIHSRR